MIRRIAVGAAVFGMVLLGAGPVRAICVGDCNGDGRVTVDEILRGVCFTICLEPPSFPEACPALDPFGTGSVTVDRILAAVSNALHGCPAAG
jgi:hypothetical protein